ncbi:MAG TPA: pantoate--beta-alanine ligase [Candidatus Alistipes merdigallinarum]|nr:pantoate--beta-alanine ligase [Candidatus Alistipes merdigallinarum]
MKVFTESSKLSEALKQRKGTCGFVPTMGALHEGHLSLVDRCRKECDTVVVSVFVNPTQFNDPNDLKNYPRTAEADIALLEKAGADFAFMPSVEEIYPEKDTRVFDFGLLDKVMEGPSRPGHFNGVAQVVSRLFDIVGCDIAYFGEKDFQQIAIIREMVRQLNYPIQIVPCPIVRNPDGLALSSRNLLLTPEHRKAAPLIYQTLSEEVNLHRAFPVEETKRRVIERINANPLLHVEYFSIVNADTLQDINDWSEAENVRGCIVVHAGAVRLIDNIAM